MEFFKKRSNEFFRGVGAEFVFKTSDGISLVSGGRILKVRVDGPLPGATASRLVLAEPDGNKHVIFEGDAVSASAKFVEIANEATSKRTPVSVSRKGAYAVLAAFTAVYLIFCHPISQPASQLPATQTSASDLDALLKSIPSLTGGVGKLNGLNIPAAVNSAVPIQPGVAADSVSPVLDKPSFLSLPEDEVSAAKADEQKTKDVAAAIPAYSADLYDKADPKAAPTADKSVPEASKPSEAATTAKRTEEASVAKTEEKPVATTETAALPAATPVKAAEAVTGKDPAAATPAVSPVDKSDAKPTDAKPDADSAAKAAKAATKDMSAAETAEVLKQIEQMMQMDPTAITPDMLSKLPHEIAQTLRDTGVIGNPESMPEKGNAPYAAIRLPPGAIDKFRGRDGIASIPENDTFAALGNKITLQLPGGGDIRKPEDLKLFGFEP
jgi:chemotaxis protein histidine kinase CheA